MAKGNQTKSFELDMLHLHVSLAMLKYLEGLKMQAYFYRLSDLVQERLTGSEQFTFNFAAETSNFVRFNKAKCMLVYFFGLVFL